MKQLILLLATCSMVGSLRAQLEADKILAAGLVEAITGAAPISQQEKQQVLKLTAQKLTQHLTFRADGTTSSICTVSTRQHVEWKGLTVKTIHKQTINEADQMNGVTQRYRVAFACAASRTWDTKVNRWSEWKAQGHPFFPSGITLEQKNGQWFIPTDSQLKWFTPGVGTSVARPPSQEKPKPAADLPPGMTRVK